MDTTFYPVREKMGAELLQRLIVERLRPLVQRWLAEQGRRALVGADQFFYWEQFNPRKALAPDVYVLDGVDPDTFVTAWKVWETGIVPCFCLEVVARDAGKDYDEAPRKYAELGVQELVLFDPHAHRAPGRVTWQVYRRSEHELVRTLGTDDDRVRSEALGCWLRRVGDGTSVRVRVATGADGSQMLPTEAERADAEATRARAESERADAEATRAGRAESELERLRAELAELRSRGD